jgi:hypothetical protein
MSTGAAAPFQVPGVTGIACSPESGRPTGVRWDSIWTDHQEEAFLTSTHLCIATTSIPAGVTSRHAPPVAIVASTPLPNRNSR